MQGLDHIPLDAIRVIAGDIEKYVRLFGITQDRKDILEFAGQMREMHRFASEVNSFSKRMEKFVKK